MTFTWRPVVSGPEIESEPAVHWSERAACGDDPDPDDWHPVGNGVKSAAADRAKGICQQWCPVRQECLDYALTRSGIHGIWGGLDDDQREELLKARIPTPSWPLCRNGLHEMTPSNTGPVSSEGFRHCEACRAKRKTERARERQRASRNRRSTKLHAAASYAEGSTP